MKTNLKLRPVYNRLEDCIRGHVVLCWLALLLIRIIENITNNTWHHLRQELQEPHVGVSPAPSSSAPNPPPLSTGSSPRVLRLGIDPPKKIIELATPATP